MKLSRYFISAVTVTAIVSVFVPCACGQEGAANGQTEPALSGSGSAGHIAIWKNSTTLGGSVMSQSGGNVGIGTKTPAAKLEVNGNAQGICLPA